MSFQNVSRGLRSVFASELLSVLGIVIFSVIATLETISVAAGIILALVAIAVLVTSLVLCLKGLKLAANEEKSFKSAYEINIVMIVIQLLYMLFGILKQWIPIFEAFTRSSSVTVAFEAVANISIVLGIKSCFARMGDDKSEKFAHGVSMLCLVSGVIEIVAAILGASLSTVLTTAPDSAKPGIAIVMVIFVLFAVVAYVSYLVLLKKAIKKLA